MVKLETATVAPEVIATLFKFKSAPEVPTEKSTLRVPPDVVSVPKVAVPVLPAVAEVIAEAVKTPPDDAGANVAVQAKDASKVLPDNAVSGLVGCVPV